jgi:hypothetical protein
VYGGFIKDGFLPGVKNTIMQASPSLNQPTLKVELQSVGL